MTNERLLGQSILIAIMDHSSAPARPGPTSSISGSSQMSNRFMTCSWMTCISARTSAAVALPVLMMKLACFGETNALPTRSPLRPAASISRPANSPSGFLKMDPAPGSVG